MIRAPTRWNGSQIVSRIVSHLRIVIGVQSESEPHHLQTRRLTERPPAVTRLSGPMIICPFKSSFEPTLAFVQPVFSRR